MPLALAETVVPSPGSFPPLPEVPEPPIFDAAYYNQLLAVLDDSSFPSTTPAEEIYRTRLRVIEAILAGRKHSSQSLSINLMVAAASMVFVCSFLLIHMRRNRQRALRGDANAARNTVLPAFEPLLWLLGGANVSYILGYGALLVARDFVVNHSRLTMELVVDAKLTNALLVPVLLLQPSLSARALCRAVCQTLLLSMYTVPVIALLNRVATRDNQRLCYWLLLASRSLLGISLVYRIASPPSRASVWMFRLFCLYIMSMQLMMFWMAEVYHRGHTGSSNLVAWAITAHSALLPVCVWYTLRADTEHWRGIGQRAVELQETFRRKNGTIGEHVSSKGLHVLIEMHRKFIIDFARLQVREPISADTTHERDGAVHRGFLHSKKTPVAIKVYVPADFTEETVAKFSHEAGLCGALVHPNIVKFLGLCVCPPNICLVTELCQGSLRDVQTTRRRIGRTASPHRQQLLIDVGYMIDAARAIAYLHSFSPPFIHRGLHPGSFLLDDQGTVKLKDFGASRTPAVRPRRSGEHQSSAGRRTVLQVDAAAKNVKAAEYMAPEVIAAQRIDTHIYGEAADVYSLAMTMWDVLHPGKAKYPMRDRNPRASTVERDASGGRDSEIIEQVFAGQRPPLGQHVPIRLRELIGAAWLTDPRMRPTARAVVASLEAIQEELCAAFALELMSTLEGTIADTTAAPRAHPQPSHSGTGAVEKMCSRNFVETRSEAIRLGSMLMDCGFLHHTKHMRAFEDGSRQFVFDAEEILACQPLTLLESSLQRATGPGRDSGLAHGVGESIQPYRTPLRDRGSDGSSLDVYTSGHQARAGSRSSHAVMENRCACRKLGQRVETELATQWRLRLNFGAVTTENLLTATLLADDEQRQSGGQFVAYGETLDQRKDLNGHSRKSDPVGPHIV